MTHRHLAVRLIPGQLQVEGGSCSQQLLAAEQQRSQLSGYAPDPPGTLEGPRYSCRLGRHRQACSTLRQTCLAVCRHFHGTERSSPNWSNWRKGQCSTHWLVVLPNRRRSNRGSSQLRLQWGNPGRNWVLPTRPMRVGPTQAPKAHYRHRILRRSRCFGQRPEKDYAGPGKL